MSAKYVWELVDPASTAISQTALDAGDYVAVGDLNLSISLRVVNQGEGLLHVELSAPSSERLFSELLAIVADNFMWYAEPAYNIFTYKFTNLLACNGRASTHLVKKLTTTIRNLTLPGPGGKGPTMLIARL